MASVTDNRRQSGFMVMLVDGSRFEIDLSLLARNAQASAQMVSEALLLRDRDMPISDMSFTACQDALTANSKRLTACMKKAHDALLGLNQDQAEKSSQDMAEAVEHLLLLLETVADIIFQVVCLFLLVSSFALVGVLLLLPTFAHS